MLTSLLVVLTLAAAAADEAAWTAEYVVRFVDDADDGTHRAEVAATLRWNRSRGSRPDDVVLSMSGGYPGGYDAFVRGLDEAERIDDDEIRYRLPVRNGRAEFDYVVPLEHDPGTGIGWDESPHAFSDGVFWTGRAFFLFVPDADATVTFEAPDDVRVSTSLAPARGDPSTYVVPRDRWLTETYFVVGRHLERTLEFEGTTFLLAVDGDLASAADTIEEQVREYVEAVIETFGGPPPARCLVAVTRSGSEEGGGAVFGQDAHFLFKGPPPKDGPNDWRRALCHELTHLWVPSHLGFDSREMWYGEGFTDYYAHLLLARIGRISGDELRRHVSGWTDAYLREAGPIGLREAGNLGAKNNILIYQGGALAALCMDVFMRASSGNRKTLDDVMRELYALNRKAGGQVSIDELARLLDRHGGRVLGGFLDRHVAGKEPLPLADAFARAGLVHEQRTVRVPEMDALVDLLQCPGMTVTPAGVEVNRTSSGKLKPDDHIVEVEGCPVSDFGDLRRALSDAAPGDEVRAIVLRRDKRVALKLRLAGHGAALPSSESKESRLTPQKKVDRKTRTIREALFGKR